MFHCAAVSSSDISGTAVSIAFYWNIAPKTFSPNLLSCAELKQQQLRKYPMMTQQRSGTHSTPLPIRSDLSGRRRLTPPRSGITIRFVLLEISVFAVQYDLFRQQITTQPRIGATDT